MNYSSLKAIALVLLGASQNVRAQPGEEPVVISQGECLTSATAGFDYEVCASDVDGIEPKVSIPCGIWQRRSTGRVRSYKVCVCKLPDEAHLGFATKHANCATGVLASCSCRSWCLYAPAPPSRTPSHERARKRRDVCTTAQIPHAIHISMFCFGSGELCAS